MEEDMSAKKKIIKVTLKAEMLELKGHVSTQEKV